MINASRRAHQRPIGHRSRCRGKERARSDRGHRRRPTDGRASQRAGRGPASARLSGARRQVGQRRSSNSHAPLIGPSPAPCRCARPWAPRSASRTRGPVGRTARRLRQCARGAMKAGPIGHAADREPIDANSIGSGRCRLNHRSTSRWTLARHAGCRAALLPS